MPFDNNAKHVMLAELATLMTRVSLHFGDPGSEVGAGNANETSAARATPTWAAPAGGELSLASNLTFTGGAANGPILWIACWSTVPLRYAKAQLSGVNTFDGAGTFVLTTGTRFRITN